MAQHYEERGLPFGKLTKKMSKKGSGQIPLDALGFKAKVFHDSAYEYVPRKKINKYSKYQKQKRQLNFRSRLSCIIDPSHATYQEIGDMKFNKRAEWKKIKYVIFRTKQLLTCCICLSKQFVAPQMTFCGHVFCWHCILMHYQKSLKANSCPVCNEVFEIQQLRTCDTIFLPPISQGDRIKLKLKLRTLDQKISFNPQNLLEETTFSHIVRMKNNKSIQKFISEHEEILAEMKRNQQPETQKYLAKVLEKSQQKIDELKKTIEQEKGQHAKIHKHQSFVQGIICQILPVQELSSQKIMAFYQQQEGRYIFLHPICEKYLRKNFSSDSLPLKVQVEVILKEQTQFSGQNTKKYKYLNHLPQNQDFQFVFIRMNQLIDYKLFEEFEKEFEHYKKKRQQTIERQQEYAKLLNEKYEKQQEYMRQLKKMQLSQYHDIKVPTNLVDLEQIQDVNIFPSLVQTPSLISSESQTQSVSNSTNKKSQLFESSKKSKKKDNRPNFKQEDFPGLQLAIKASLNQAETNDLELAQKVVRTHSQNIVVKQKAQTKEQCKNDFPDLSNLTVVKHQSLIGTKGKKKNSEQEDNQTAKRKGKKKKKQKFVDVTHQFFQRNQQEDY